MAMSNPVAGDVAPFKRELSKLKLKVSSLAVSGGVVDERIKYSMHRLLAAIEDAETDLLAISYE